MVDEAKLNQFIGNILVDLGGAFSVPMVRMGDKLGLYKALKQQGPMTPAQLAAKTNVAERYTLEWLSHQATSGYLDYDQAVGKFALPPEQAMVFADVDSPVYLQGAFDLAVAMVENQPKVEAAFRSGKGVGWGDQAQCLFCTVGRFFRPGYHNSLVASWLPALDGVTAKLESGAKVADVGCGHGFSTIIMAKAFPEFDVRRLRFSSRVVAQARAHAEQHGATANTQFEVATASDFPGKELDLVTFFDCLHDMGDPVGAARHVRETLKPDGSWMIVEPAAGDRLENNLNPVSRMFYAASTMICVPTSLDQPVGAALGGPSGLRQGVVSDFARRIRQGAQGDRDTFQHDSRSASLMVLLGAHVRKPLACEAELNVVLAALTRVEFCLGAHLRTPERAVPLVIVEPLDGLISLADALGVIGPYSFGDIVHVVRPQEEVAGQNVPTEHIHHLSLALRGRGAARCDLLEVEDNDARRSEIEPRRVVIRTGH